MNQDLESFPLIPRAEIRRLDVFAEYNRVKNEQKGLPADVAIVQRMGSDFYRRVFAPAVAAAIAERQSYEQMRDRLRVKFNLRKMAA